MITERFDEAMNPRHCALSLVGEPIIYPEINEFLDYMHSHGISSFMVTNAQFPAAIETLRPVTQLYVSIDAGNERTYFPWCDRFSIHRYRRRHVHCLTSW